MDTHTAHSQYIIICKYYQVIRREKVQNEQKGVLTGLPGGPVGPVSPGVPGWPYHMYTDTKTNIDYN